MQQLTPLINFPRAIRSTVPPYLQFHVSDPRITKNERDVAEVRSEMGVIKTQVQHNGEGINRLDTKSDRIIDKLDNIRRN